MTATAAVLDSVHLEFRSGGSDKEYHIYLCDHGGTYTVHAEFGRRHSVSQRSEKGTFRSRADARAAFSKWENEKRHKSGYSTMSTVRPPKSIPSLGTRPAPAAPPVAPAFDSALLAFNDKLLAYVTAMAPDELSAGRTATARLANDMGVSSRKDIESLPSFSPMVAMLGAIAFASEDYTDDAVEVGAGLISAKSASGGDSEKAVALMPPTLTRVLSDVLTEHPRSDGLAGLVRHLFKKGCESWFI